MATSLIIIHVRAKTYYLTNDKSLPVSFHCIMGYEAHNYVSSVTNILRARLEESSELKTCYKPQNLHLLTYHCINVKYKFHT